MYSNKASKNYFYPKLYKFQLKGCANIKSAVFGLIFFFTIILTVVFESPNIVSVHLYISIPLKDWIHSYYGDNKKIIAINWSDKFSQFVIDKIILNLKTYWHLI